MVARFEPAGTITVKATLFAQATTCSTITPHLAVACCARPSKLTDALCFASSTQLSWHEHEEGKWVLYYRNANNVCRHHEDRSRLVGGSCLVSANNCHPRREPNGDQGAGGAKNLTVAATEVKRPRRDGAKRRSRRGGATNATVAATEMRRPMRLRTERRSRRVGKKNAAAAATELRRLSFINNHNLKSSHAQHDSEMVSSSRCVDSAATVCAHWGGGNAVSSPPGHKAAGGHATPLLLD